MTVIYYTSNRETESFESKIRAELLKSCNGLPIVSVSQKPIDLGKNICVGETELSNANIKRQILVGAKAATTENVCMAEADFIYPKEYFEFVPPEKDTIYYLDNLYVMWCNRSRFYRKGDSDGALVCNRLHLIELLSSDQKPNKVLYGKRKPFTTDIPAITFKTGNGTSWRCPYIKGKHVLAVPYWGTAKNLRKKFK